VKYIVAVLAIAGCGSEPDPRPGTFPEIVDAILVPSCGRAACHSSATRARDMAFDTIDNARAAMMTTQGRRGQNQKMVVPGDATRSRLFTVLTDGGRIMPPDQPLADADIALIGAWIDAGAPGL
jgi:hypothetical protein